MRRFRLLHRGNLSLQRPVVRLLLRCIEQRELCRGDFVEQLLRMRGAIAHRHVLQVRHQAVGGRIDHVLVRLEQIDPQQPIMVRGLIFERNTQPLVIRVEGSHGASMKR